MLYLAFTAQCGNKMIRCSLILLIGWAIVLQFVVTDIHSASVPKKKAGNPVKTTTLSSSTTKVKNATDNATSPETTNQDSDTDKDNQHTISSWTTQNIGMLKRGFYVLLVVTAIIAVYFGVRIYRTRNKKVKKYGLLSSGGGGERIGLNPIDSDSEDDYTVFETKTLH